MPAFFCVDSPFAGHCGIEAVERIEQGVRSRVLMRPELTNSWGGAHGGLVATLLDASMTVAARYAAHPDGRIATSTTDLSVSFIGQAQRELRCDAVLTSRRGSVLFLEARCWNEDGDLVARAVGTFRAARG